METIREPEHSDESEALDTQGWVDATSELLASAGFPVLHVPYVEKSDSSPVVVVDPDEDGISTIVEIVTSLAPPLVLFVDTSMVEEGPSMTFHLLWSGSSIAVECMLGNWGGGHASEESALAAVTHAELDELMADAVAYLASRDEPKLHDNVRPLRDAIIARLEELRPLSDADREYLEFAAYSPANDLHEILMDSHREKFFLNASTYAAGIFAEAEIPVDAKIAVIRSVVYRHMKRIDPKCTIKTELGSIEAALEKLVRAQ